MIDRFNNRQ